MKVVFYTDNCPKCLEVKMFLSSLVSEFEEVNVLSEGRKARLWKRTRQSRVPAFEIKHS